MTEFALIVNGRSRDLSLAPRVSLADALREGCGLTGTHLGCEHGVCGACTVLLDGQPARSCITFAVACAGADVTTIEGLDDDELAGELREAFRRRHALQCGYCTPGMLIAARDLALRAPLADEKAIRVGLGGQLCRCTGYVGIVAAVQDVIAARRARGVGALSGAGRTALGPVGARAAVAVAGEAPAPAPPRDEAAPAEARPAEFEPAHAFALTFSLPLPPDRVFAHFADIRSVAAAVPGLALVRASADRAEGSFAVALGPVKAQFRGHAEISRDEPRRAGRILAAGGDPSSRSRARGVIDYRVTPGEGDDSIVALEVGYSLTGLLAQLGRPGLIETVARGLIADFARNLERQISGEAGPAAPFAARLPLWALLRGWLREWWTRRRRRR